MKPSGWTTILNEKASDMFAAGDIRLQSEAFSEGEMVTISIYNTHGQIVYQNTTSFKPKLSFLLNNLVPGMYQVFMISGVQSGSERLIIK